MRFSQMAWVRDRTVHAPDWVKQKGGSHGVNGDPVRAALQHALGRIDICLKRSEVCDFPNAVGGEPLNGEAI